MPCGDGNLFGLIAARMRIFGKRPPRHFEEWIYRTFGRGIAKNFMVPYNRRQWAWDLTDMSFDWIAERVPMPPLADLVRGLHARGRGAVQIRSITQ